MFLLSKTAMPRLGSHVWTKVIVTLYLLVVLPLPLHAENSPHKPGVKPVVVAQTSVASNHALTLKQLGARLPITLRGAAGRDGVSFNVRADEVVTQARLKLNFSYSPALLSDVSHINVLVNGEVAGSLEIPKNMSLSAVMQVVDLPPRFLTEYNKIDFQLVGRESVKCEDPAHSSLWATISNMSTLEVTSEPVTLNSDLSTLPLPFMDRRDARQLQLPFVFVGTVDNEMLEAAGTVSSWFGAFAGYRGANFPASLNTIPSKGHAVVFVAGQLPWPGMARPAVSGPMLSMVSNPNDPDGKLLLISGQDSHELRVAVAALTLGTGALVGRSMWVKPQGKVAERQPYDAPNWLASHRPVKFSDMSNPAAMTVSGHNPGAIRLNMRLPPDLFRWNDPGIPVSLKYRYTPQPFNSANSSLLVNFNEQLVKSVPLLPVDRWSSLLPVLPMLTALLPDKSQPLETRLNVPMYTLAHQSQLQLNFKYADSSEGQCGDTVADNLHGAIEPDSWIDISAYSHYLAMPNLTVFNDSGFPFTRLADLSETAVILPDAPSLREYTTYLDLMGRLGQSTGYPGIAVSVARAGQIDKFSDKDLLLIATGDNQPLLTSWRHFMAVQPDDTSSFKLFGFDVNPFKWALTSAVAAPQPPTAGLLEGSTPRAVLLGFESPLARGRSAVLLWGAQPDDLNQALLAMADGDGLARYIKGAVSVIQDKSVESAVGNSVYYVGHLSWLTQLRWRLSENLALFLAVSLVSAMLLAAMLRATLKRIAKKRLV